MHVGWIVGGVLLALMACAAAAHYMLLRPRGYHQWLGRYVREAGKRRPPEPEAEVHVRLCFADHFEPRAQDVSVSAGQARVDHWVREYPRQFARFRDSDGRNPRHSFFFP